MIDEIKYKIYNNKGLELKFDIKSFAKNFNKTDFLRKLLF
jgi:hypothetical protein